MQEYEQPLVCILEFLPQNALASSKINEPSLANSGDDMSVGETPTLGDEDVGDW